MPGISNDLRETHCVGQSTVEHRVSKQICPTLIECGINLAGVSIAGPDFRFVRWHPTFTQILVCTGGFGHAYIDRQWVPMKPGSVYVTPPNHMHAYQTDPEMGKWEVCWVIVPSTAPSQLPGTPEKPMMAETDPELFRAAIAGLCCEVIGKNDVAMLESWVRLIRGLSARITGSAPKDQVIDQLWKKVAAKLVHPWTLEEMAATLGCSEEHLRRLCQRRFGCSPMRRLLSLRMQHAASLLSGTNLTVAAVGEQIGYENEFAFSNAFKRWSHGTPPSIYRKKANATS